jgi:HEPN domain-containing protein
MTPIAAEWLQKAEEDYAVAQWVAASPTAAFNAICFHCQQCVEKYLKCRLQEAGIPFARTHDLEVLLDTVLPVEPGWAPLRPQLKFLRPFSTETRYPGVSASADDAREVMQICTGMRRTMRDSMGLG